MPDLLFGGLLGAYPATAYPAVVTWAALAGFGFLIYILLRPHPLALYIPTFAVACLALFGAIVGHHPHSYAVAPGMALHSVLVLRGYRVSSVGKESAPAVWK